MSIPVETIISGRSAVSSTLAADDERTLAESGFYWRERDGVKLLVCSSLERAGFANGFSTRLGGVSPFPHNDLNLAGFSEDSAENIAENRRRFFRLFDDEYKLAAVWQVHGNTVKTIAGEADLTDSDDNADGMVSELSGVMLGVKTADCVPVLIGDPVSGAFAAIHAGWRGTALSIVVEAVEKMGSEFGAKPQDLIAAIGPAASCRSYEIGRDVIDDFERNFGADSRKYFTPTRDGHAYVDLQAANRDQGIATGIRAANIHTAPYCTMECPDLFFSYRLEKQKNGKTGRLMSVIGRKAIERRQTS